MRPWSQPLLWPHPSAAVACDPYFGNVVLLMGYEGPNGSTTTGFQDESPSAHGFGNPVGAVIDTSQFKFGTSSVRLNNAAIIFGNSADWHFGSGQYTVECWFRPNSNPGQGFFVGQWLTVGNSAWVMNTGVSGSTLTWNMSPDGGTTNIVAFNGSWAFATGTWYHIAVDFDGTNTRGYVNGVMVGKYTTPVTIFTSSNNLGIGANSGATSFIVDGWMDELRITKGVARYASDSGFAVPTAAFPRVQC